MPSSRVRHQRHVPGNALLLAADHPGAALREALASLLARLDKDDSNFRVRMHFQLGFPPVPTVEEAIAAYDAWIEQARAALARGAAHGWDKPEPRS